MQLNNEILFKVDHLTFYDQRNSLFLPGFEKAQTILAQMSMYNLIFIKIEITWTSSSLKSVNAV